MVMLSHGNGEVWPAPRDFSNRHDAAPMGWWQRAATHLLQHQDVRQGSLQGGRTLQPVADPELRIDRSKGLDKPRGTPLGRSMLREP
jgi:hypothetical protein